MSITFSISIDFQGKLKTFFTFFLFCFNTYCRESFLFLATAVLFDIGKMSNIVIFPHFSKTQIGLLYFLFHFLSLLENWRCSLILFERMWVFVITNTHWFCLYSDSHLGKVKFYLVCYHEYYKFKLFVLFG